MGPVISFRVMALNAPVGSGAYDYGVGRIVRSKIVNLDDETKMYHLIEVTQGNFDAHRNADGEFWIHDGEILRQ